MNKIPEIHQWTHDGDRVLLVKCLNRDGTSYGGFIWPSEGEVAPDKFSRDATCKSGGLFGWPWGLGIGIGKAPDAVADWLVFSAKPENVIWVDGKAKVVPGEDGDLPKVIYRGTQAGAMEVTMLGRVAWIEARSSGSTSETGANGSASATKWGGIASATGANGSASVTGANGSASVTRWGGSASATGENGCAIATGVCGSASATGENGIASATGVCGSTSVTGVCASANATGWKGSASVTGWKGSVSVTGANGSASAIGRKSFASATGDGASVSTLGEGASAGATGWGSSVSATGEKSIAAVTGEYSTLDVRSGIAAATAQSFTWISRPKAVLIAYWELNGEPQHSIFIGAQYQDGERLLIEDGCRVEQFKV